MNDDCIPMFGRERLGCDDVLQMLLVGAVDGVCEDHRFATGVVVVLMGFEVDQALVLVVDQPMGLEAGFGALFWFVVGWSG